VLTLDNAADFVIRSDGVCRLNPEMAVTGNSLSLKGRFLSLDQLQSFGIILGKTNGSVNLGGRSEILVPFNGMMNMVDNLVKYSGWASSLDVANSSH
jgi:hypothetical protein